MNGCPLEVISEKAAVICKTVHTYLHAKAYKPGMQEYLL